MPHKDFPLFKHQTGRWAKKIRGKHEYFGKIEGDENGAQALERWLETKDDLLAGRRPRIKSNAVTIEYLCNHFLLFKEQLRDGGEIAPRTFDRLLAACKAVREFFGPARQVDDIYPENFQALRASLAKRLGPVALGNEIGMIRSVFKYGHEAGLLPAPIRFGPAFKKPTAKVLRQERSAGGPRMYTAKQINALLKAATSTVKAMVLLAINGGLGNTDLGKLPIAAIDVSGWLDYPRQKTGVARRIPLWPETLAAIKAVMKCRRIPRDPADAKLLFIGARGVSFVNGSKGDYVAKAFAAVQVRAKIEGRTFYDLRRTFQTIAEEAHDAVAVQAIMGHAPASGDMASVYRQAVSDDRLLTVTNYVRQWLFKR